MIHLFLIFFLLSPGFCLEIVTTTPELKALVKVLAPDASVHAIVHPKENAHMIEVRPSHVRKVNKADLFVFNGLELEIGWVPLLVRQARNPEVQAGKPGYLDASQGILALEIPDKAISRADGHIHAMGNPHYMLDPVQGWRVAKLLLDRLSAIDHEGEAVYRERYHNFTQELARSLVGEEIVNTYSPEKLLQLILVDQWKPFFERTGEISKLKGWLSQIKPRKVLQGHAEFVYFTHRFGLSISESLEPKPGIKPSLKYLARKVKAWKEEGVEAVLTSPHFPNNLASFASNKIGVPMIVLSHQFNANDESANYLEWISHNLTQLEVLEDA